MSITKFPAAFAATLLVVSCALAQTETRLPEVGVSAPRAGAQDYPLLAGLHQSENGYAPARAGGVRSGNTE